MSVKLTRRDFAIRMAGFGLALGLTPAVTLAQAGRASRVETSAAVADPYALVDPELLPALKQFPVFDVSAELVHQFRQMPEHAQRYLLLRRNPWNGVFPGRKAHLRFVCGSLILRRRRCASRCCYTFMAVAL